MEPTSIPPRLVVRRASPAERHFAEPATRLIARAASLGADIAARSVDELEEKIAAGHAVVVLNEETHVLLGFGYLSPWAGPSMSYSGIVVSETLRGKGIGHRILEELLKIGMDEAPDASHFMLSTSPAMIAIAKSNGFGEAPLALTTPDAHFWAGCKGCPRYNAINHTPPAEDSPHRTPLGMACCCTAFVLNAPPQQ